MRGRFDDLFIRLAQRPGRPSGSTDRRPELLHEQPATAPRGGTVIVIGDAGDRKDGSATGHLHLDPRQLLAQQFSPLGQVHPQFEAIPDGRSRAADLRSDQHDNLIETARQHR